MALESSPTSGIRRFPLCPAIGRLLLMALLLPSSGCQWVGTSFQMDSDSFTPAFGFELMPRRAAAEKESGDSVVHAAAGSPAIRPVTTVARRSARNEAQVVVPIPRTDLDDLSWEFAQE